MNTGLLLLIFGTIFAVGEVCIGVFVFTRAGAIAGKTGKPAAPLRTLGRVQMIGGVVILIAVLATAFGVIHLFPNIHPIQF